MWRDCYRKSPGFIAAAVGYASALASSDKLEEAEVVLDKAILLPGHNHQALNLRAQIYLNKGEYDLAEDYFNRAYMDTQNDARLVTMGPLIKKNILLGLATVDAKRASESKDETDRKMYYSKAIETSLKAYKESNDTFMLYNISKMYLRIDEDEKAVELLKEFVKRWKNDYYKEAAQGIIEKAQ